MKYHRRRSGCNIWISISNGSDHVSPLLDAFTEKVVIAGRNIGVFGRTVALFADNPFFIKSVQLITIDDFIRGGKVQATKSREKLLFRLDRTSLSVLKMECFSGI